MNPTTTRKALVPISLDNPQFRTAVLAPALKPIVRDYDQLIFLIADRLQVYNKARRLANGDIGVLLENFDALSKAYFEQRSRWIEKLRRMLERDGYKCDNWRILSVQDVTDGDFYSIFRNVFLASQTIAPLAQDIRDALAGRIGASERTGTETRLCETYLIEEIAINIRLRLHEEIRSEFYLGETIAPLLGLYEGAYGVDVFSLARRPKAPLDFSFFSPARNNTSGRPWVPIHYQEVGRGSVASPQAAK